MCAGKHGCGIAKHDFWLAISFIGGVFFKHAYKAYGFNDLIVRQLSAMSARHTVTMFVDPTYGGLFVKSVFNNTGTRVISLTSWM